MIEEREILKYLSDFEIDKRITKKEENKKIKMPGHAYYLGYLDSCEDLKHFIEKLRKKIEKETQSFKN